MAVLRFAFAVTAFLSMLSVSLATELHIQNWFPVSRAAETVWASTRLDRIPLDPVKYGIRTDDPNVIKLMATRLEQQGFGVKTNDDVIELSNRYRSWYKAIQGLETGSRTAMQVVDRAIQQSAAVNKAREEEAKANPSQNDGSVEDELSRFGSGSRAPLPK